VVAVCCALDDPFRVEFFPPLVDAGVRALLVFLGLLLDPVIVLEK
jgi:hypothetical protein